MVRFGVLGPVVVDGEHGLVDLRGARQRAVLARLLVAGGRVVPVHRLIDDLWDVPPEGALGAVQTFVGALRKALEPDRAPRTPSRLLVTVPPGYALKPHPDTVDAGRFEAAVVAAGELLGAGRTDAAHTLLDEALGLWRGPAYAEFADRAWAHGEAARLDELRLVGVERRAEATRAAEAVATLEAHVADHPLREDAWRLLAIALYRSGRQGDALATLRRARGHLRAELGVDPGPRLREAEADILAQSPRLTAHRAGPVVVVARVPAGTPFVGRTAELAELVDAAGRTRLALVAGEAGTGKTALVEALRDRLGWTTAWGSSPELPGAPAAWPLTQMREVLGNPAADPSDDPLTARFRRHRAMAARLATVAAAGPVLLVLDDLHWADEETLALLTLLATEPIAPTEPAGPVLIVGTYRSTAISPALAAALGRVARAEPLRIHLGGLPESQVGELVAAVTEREVTAATATVIHARTAGNPFFVRELARVWDESGDAALTTVPAGIRDVIRHRLAGFPDAARTHLHQAALLGDDVELDVLIRLAGDEDAVLDSVESAQLAGFLVERDADRLRFAHALVRETLYAEIPGARRVRWHAAVGEIIEQARPQDVETIAHHLLRAEAQVAPARTARFARAAAQQAERRFAPHEAVRLWRATVAALDRAGGATRDRLDAVMGMVRALAITGDLPAAREYRAAAVTAVESLGDPLRTAAVIGAFDVPAIWTADDDPQLSAGIVAAAERTLAALPPGHDAARARLLVTIAMERRGDAGERGGQAAREAETIARASGNPTLLAYALNGRFMQTCHRAGLAPQRAAIGAELLELAGRHAGLVTFEVLGHLIVMQASSALADIAAADRHAAAADALARRHEIPLVGVFTAGYAALRLAVTGQRADADAAYRRVATRLAGTGMGGLEAGMLPLALLCLNGPDRRPTGDATAWGPYEPWAGPLVDPARSGAVPDSPRDLLLEVRTCLHAMIAIRDGDAAGMERAYAQLLPAAGELAAGSGLVTLGPVAFHLARLAGALGRPAQAAEHHRQGVEVRSAAISTASQVAGLPTPSGAT